MSCQRPVASLMVVATTLLSAASSVTTPEGMGRLLPASSNRPRIDCALASDSAAQNSSARNDVF